VRRVRRENTELTFVAEGSMTRVAGDTVSGFYSHIQSGYHSLRKTTNVEANGKYRLNRNMVFESESSRGHMYLFCLRSIQAFM
jgi:hypothetical protein